MEALSTKVADMLHAKEEISAIQYSPDGTKLAAGSHDNYIYVYDVLQVRVCGGRGRAGPLIHTCIHTSTHKYTITLIRTHPGLQLY